MCTNGINASQLRGAIEQVDEAVALTRRWTHRCYHSAFDGQLPRTADKLKAVQVLLDEARALLSEAGDLVEQEVPVASVTVELV
ncbi:MAG: hypothetical protein LBD25_00135 [Coriobacteriales bacterium]|jgi:hypothetical protein|nr:hypothetical protein [Coriobacteriales bacterium]